MQPAKENQLPTETRVYLRSANDLEVEDGPEKEIR
jgi:hypothetical protein